MPTSWSVHGLRAVGAGAEWRLIRGEGRAGLEHLDFGAI